MQKYLLWQNEQANSNYARAKEKLKRIVYIIGKIIIIISYVSKKAKKEEAWNDYFDPMAPLRRLLLESIIYLG